MKMNRRCGQLGLHHTHRMQPCPVKKMIRDAQDSVHEAIEASDGGGRFKEDVWLRLGGGGGISRVLQEEGVWEKADVNVSVVYGVMPPEAYRAAEHDPDSAAKAGGQCCSLLLELAQYVILRFSAKF